MVSDTNILITTTRDAGINNVAFDGFRFVDLNANIPNFTNVTLDGATNYAGFSSSRITTAANTIFVNVEDLAGLQGQIISLDIGGEASAVPEPSSVLLMELSCWRSSWLNSGGPARQQRARQTETDSCPRAITAHGNAPFCDGAEPSAARRSHECERGTH